MVFDNLASAVELPFENQESDAALTETEQLTSLEADEKGGIGRASRAADEEGGSAAETSISRIDDLAPVASEGVATAAAVNGDPAIAQGHVTSSEVSHQVQAATQP
ncbi:MAG: hypothetical protein ACRBM6_22655 [Geminicoccales bacterium]